MTTNLRQLARCRPIDEQGGDRTHSVVAGATAAIEILQALKILVPYVTCKKQQL